MSEIKVKTADLTRFVKLYDGTESEFLKLEFAVPGSRGITFRADDFLDHAFENLSKLLGADIFDRIVSAQGFTHSTIFRTYSGTDRLQLYYVIHQPVGDDVTSIVLVAFGEFQPARYMIHVEGIWDVVGLE